MDSLAVGLQRLFTWVVRLTFVNFLWLLFTLLGGVVLGFGPATVAMFSVTRQWQTGDPDVAIFTTFWRTFRADFWSANALSWLLAVLGAALWLDIRLLPLQGGVVGVLLGSLSVGLLIAFCVALLFVFPLFVHFRLKTLQHLKWGLAIGLGHPLLTLAMGAGLAALYLLLIKSGVPALVLVVGGSLPAVILTWGAQKAFVRYQSSRPEVSAHAH